MSQDEKIKELEFRIFDLEKKMDLISQKMTQITESLSFQLNESNSNEKEKLNIETLLTAKEACEVLNLTKSKLMEWVQNDLIEVKRVGNIHYFDKDELKLVFRKMMLKK
jgi:excisionase family DNA binding protein